jgi:hypothetical protein
MQLLFTLYVAFLFFILTPAILVRLPPKAGKFTVAGFHAVVFGLILHFTGKIVWNFARNLEGFQEGNKASECVKNKNYTGNNLNTPTDGTGNQSCGAANKTYCDGLVYDGKNKGFYTYVGSQNRTQCVEVKKPVAPTDSCNINVKHTKTDLNTPNDGAGHQSCGAANKTYCDGLVYNGKKKGFYTYVSSENRTNCIEKPQSQQRKK